MLAVSDIPQMPQLSCRGEDKYPQGLYVRQHNPVSKELRV